VLAGWHKILFDAKQELARRSWAIFQGSASELLNVRQVVGDHCHFFSFTAFPSIAITDDHRAVVLGDPH
jgi:hypothetical protein